ncbi:PHP domain-containing protein [Ruminococcaceae bacterium OttesenSCG-928-A16]|nr:PHP domain-containing protein [Ruminococcaceae bacterium OttesenSCG-928-A16]
MNLVADLHTHTSVSHHALSTLHEMVEQAKSLGLKTIAITDHAPAMPDSPHLWYFNSLLRLPHILPGGFLLLKG